MISYVGCSGYFYWGWKGRFYPQELKPNQWFEYYSSIFDTVEINSTFYHFPKSSTVKKWYSFSPEGFIFSVKVNKQITHIKRMKDVKQLLSNFYSVVSDNLREKTGVFLFQLPPSYRYSKENILRIVEAVDSSYKNAVEFRHVSWWREEVYQILRKYNICFCSISAPNLPEELIKTTDYGYIRFHGRESWYRYNYSYDELVKWADRIKENRFKEIFVYFNNDFFAYAPENAKLFRKILSEKQE